MLNTFIKFTMNIFEARDLSSQYMYKWELRTNVPWEIEFRYTYIFYCTIAAEASDVAYNRAMDTAVDRQ